MKKDVTQKHYLNKSARIADLLDGYYFNGAQVIRPEDVKKEDGEVIMLKNGKPDSELIERYQDLVFKIVKGVNCFIFCVEEQNYVDHAMVLRSLEYTVGQYEEQRQEIMDYHRNAKNLTGDEFISGFSLQDRLKPVILLVLYLGDEEWQGARTLHELLDWTDIPEAWKTVVADYRMHILEVQKIEDLNRYHSDLKLLFGILKYRKDKEKMNAFMWEHREEFQNVAVDLAKVIQQYSHSQKVFKMIEKIEKEEKPEKKEGTVNMMDAFDEICEDYRKEGMKEGINAGIKEGTKQFGELVLRLLSENRMDDLELASKDSKYRESLMGKYGIVR